jgi:hypothetical protein
MKKTLILFIAMIAAIGLIAMVGCSKKAETGPDTNATATAVAIAAATAQATVFNFETDQTGSWASDGTVCGTLAWNDTGVNSNTSLGSMECPVVFSGTATGANGSGQVKYTWPWGTSDFTYSDFTNRTLRVRVYIPAGLVDANYPYGLYLFVQDSTWTWRDQVVNITASGWQTFSWKVADSCNTCGSGDVTKIIQAGVKIAKSADASPDYTGTVYFDDFVW